MYKEKAFSLNKSHPVLVNANFLENNSLMLLIHPTITSNEILRRSKILKQTIIDASI